MKINRTTVFRRDLMEYVKYKRFEKRHKNKPVRVSPCFLNVQIEDIVTYCECRSLSKTVSSKISKAEISLTLRPSYGYG
ncbi:30S ribosomal protein S11, chloroplastic [Hymenolepis weldensis]